MHTETVTVERYYRPRDLPRWTGMSLAFWEKVIAERQIDVYRGGRAVLVRGSDVEKFLRRGFEPARGGGAA
ncbi:MAG: hypothetical protein C5B48_10550 [Candidatus Rokuibacteriota bacterium]|nr:MAG: hypothetical protein C5B48_10550 [Candidatus Rokubacteria bacterium]